MFEVIDTDLNADDVTAQGKDNASVTVLPKNDENIIRILLESEDHAERNVFDVVLGKMVLPPTIPTMRPVIIRIRI